MPIYEYECADCRRKQSFLVMNPARDLPALRCKKCGGPHLNRLVSRVNVVKSEEARLESLADPSKLGGLDENDPKSMARWMRKMSAETGEEMPEEFDEVMGRLESGQSPEEIEEAMPDLASDMGGMGGMGGMDDLE